MVRPASGADIGMCAALVPGQGAERPLVAAFVFRRGDKVDPVAPADLLCESLRSNLARNDDDVLCLDEYRLRKAMLPRHPPNPTLPNALKTPER